jgi:hypothetical protein
MSSGTLLATWGQEGASANERLVLRPLFNPVHGLRMAGWKTPANGGYTGQFVIVAILPPAEKSSSSGHGK